jgi:hypothetical protein
MANVSPVTCDGAGPSRASIEACQFLYFSLLILL